MVAVKAYYYTPSDCGMQSFPPGELRLAGVAEALPDQADVFVVPPILHTLLAADPEFHPSKLPYYNAETEIRHAFWNVGDNQPAWFKSKALFIRCDATRQMLADAPNTIGWPWPVESLYRPHEGFEYDAVFQGWNSTDLTHRAVESVRCSGLKAHLVENDFFWGYHDTEPEYAHYRASFLDTLSKARLSIVPRSIPGTVRYRFWEAMSMGRVPVQLCDDCVMPWPDQVNYAACSISVLESDVDQLGDILKVWLAKLTDDDIVAMGRYGHAAYENWLHRDRWSILFTQAVRDHLLRNGLSTLD